MISIVRKEDCVGCGACNQKCPTKCISLDIDEQGFLYPIINIEKCINCGLCEKICPVVNQKTKKNPIQVLAAKNSVEKIKDISSSGGVFYSLAEYIIKKGGVVFGVKFNRNWNVVHGYSESLDGIRCFQGSKYVQSIIGDSYKDVEFFLKQGRRVLFSGTPCQVAGLKLYLRKDWGEQLLTVDIVCHGVPSPMIWEEYIKYIMRPKGADDGKNTVLLSLNKMSVISDIKFRDKRLGWEKYGFSVRCAAATERSGKNSVFQSDKHKVSLMDDIEILYEPFNENMYMKGFLRDIYLRPSCYECPAKSGKSGADITLADFWGIQNTYPELYDSKGVSLVLVNSVNGQSVIEQCGLIKQEVIYESAIAGNPAIIKSPNLPPQSAVFWREINKKGLECLPCILKSMQPKSRRGLIYYLKRVIRKVVGDKGVHIIKKII